MNNTAESNRWEEVVVRLQWATNQFLIKVKPVQEVCICVNGRVILGVNVVCMACD